jgi:hemerythrin-like domain-containing protein
MSNDLNLGIMLGLHEALRRDLVRLARAAERRAAVEPVNQLALANSWATFKRQLLNHHSVEDVVIWPALGERLAGSASAMSVLLAMEDEHKLIDPLLEAVDAAFGAEDGRVLKDVLAETTTVLHGHLAHEERDALPLFGETWTQEEWAGVQQAMMAAGVGGPAIGAEMFPWILEGADEALTEKVLGPLPPLMRQMFAETWRPAYEAEPRLTD